MTWCNQRWLEIILLGLLLGIGFVIPPLWLLGFLGIAGLVYRIDDASYTWWQVWLVWYIKSLLVTSWVWRVYPLDWIGFELGARALPLVGVYWVSVSAMLAIGGIALWGMVQVWRYWVNVSYWQIAIPIFWLVAELVGSFAFALFLYGPGGAIGFKFSLGYIGYLWGEHGVGIQAAAIAGVYGLSVLYVALSMCGLWLYRCRRMYTLVASIGLLLVSTGWSQTVQMQTVDTYKIAVIDTQLPIAITPAELRTVHSEMLQAINLQAFDYVLFPEGNQLFDQSLASSSLQALLSFQFGGSDTIMIDSGRVDTQRGAYLQAAVFDDGTDTLYQSQKRYLVPQGEYMSYIFSVPLRLLGQTNEIKDVPERFAYRPGNQTHQGYFADEVPAVLFCFESFDPQGVRTVLSERNQTVPFVAHVVSQAWLHHSPVFEHQTATMLRVQAIWNDTYIVSAANHAVGYTVTPQGDILYPSVIDRGEYWQVGVIAIPTR